MATAKKVPARRGRPPKPKAKPMKVTPVQSKPVSYKIERKPDLAAPAVVAAPEAQATKPVVPPAPSQHEEKLARFAADNHKLGAEVQQLKAENGKLKKVKDDLAEIEQSHRELVDRITALRQSTE